MQNGPVWCWRIAINQPCILRPDWRQTVTGEDARFYFCKPTLWAALERFPEACQTSDQALIEAFGGEGADAECPLEKSPSQTNGDGGRDAGDAPAGSRET
jgi:hypothetical protein